MYFEALLDSYSYVFSRNVHTEPTGQAYPCQLRHRRAKLSPRPQIFYFQNFPSKSTAVQHAAIGESLTVVQIWRPLDMLITRISKCASILVHMKRILNTGIKPPHIVRTVRGLHCCTEVHTCDIQDVIFRIPRNAVQHRLLAHQLLLLQRLVKAEQSQS